VQESESIVEKLLEPYRAGHGANGQPSNGQSSNRQSLNGHGSNGRPGASHTAGSHNHTPLAGPHGDYQVTALRLQPGSAQLSARSPSTLNAQPATRSEQFALFQSDAPACDNCGAITVRNGNCYLCHNCGQSMGCS